MNESKENKTSARVFITLAATAALAVAVLLIRHVLPSPTNSARASLAGRRAKRNCALNGIIRSEDHLVAVINGVPVREGDRVAGAEIIQILPDRVRLRTEGTEWTLKLPSIRDDAAAPLPVMLQLSSPRCPACKKMEPVIKRLKADYDQSFRVIHIDPWKNSAAAEKYAVTAIPTQIFYDKTGAELYRHVGFYSRREIIDTWKKLGIQP